MPRKEDATPATRKVETPEQNLQAEQRAKDAIKHAQHARQQDGVQAPLGALRRSRNRVVPEASNGGCNPQSASPHAAQRATRPSAGFPKPEVSAQQPTPEQHARLVRQYRKVTSSISISSRSSSRNSTSKHSSRCVQVLKGSSTAAPTVRTTAPPPQMPHAAAGSSRIRSSTSSIHSGRAAAPRAVSADGSPHAVAHMQVMQVPPNSPQAQQAAAQDFHRRQQFQHSSNGPGAATGWLAAAAVFRISNT